MRWLVESTLSRSFLRFEIVGNVIFAMLATFYVNWQVSIFLTIMSPLLIISMRDFKAKLTQEKSRKIKTDKRARDILNEIVQKHQDIVLIEHSNLNVIANQYVTQYRRQIDS